MRVPYRSSCRPALVALVVAIVAGGIPALLTTSASAATTGDIQLAGPTRGAAGSCLTYTVTPTDSFGRVATDSGTVVIRLSENPTDTGQDVDFCTPTGSTSTPTVAPHYLNANNVRQTYTAGPSVTTPDVASTTTPAAQANPSGKDTAVFVYDGRRGDSTVVTFGAVGLVPGRASIDAFRSADGDEVQSPGDYAKSLAVTFTDGGLPGSPQAADAVRAVAVTPKTSYSPVGGPAHVFSALLTNASGDGVAGVRPAIAATAGPNAATSTTNATFTASCTSSDNAGRSTCTYSGSKSGSDTITVWVDQTTARTPTPTAGIDPNEPRDTATAVSTVGTGQAKLIDLLPATDTVAGGQSKVLTATATDANGTPAAGVAITFSETGPGSISGGTAGPGGTSTLNATTDASGKATVTILTATTDSGTSTVTVTFRTPGSTACQSSGGRCTDSSTLTVNGSSPSPSPSRSAGPSPTAAPRPPLTLAVNQPLIAAGSTATMTARGGASQAYQLQCYTRPSTTYFTARTGTFDAAADPVTFTLALGRNTRCFIQYATGAAGASPSVVVNVRTVLSLTAVRTGPRTYLFQGRNLPRAAGQLITLYRLDRAGNEIRTSSLVTDSSGIYRVSRTFTGTGTFPFRVRTSQTLNNAAGASSTIVVAIR